MTPRKSPELSIIVPVLNEAAGITAHLAMLAPLRAAGVELLVVDGGSTDATMALAFLADTVLSAPQGRATQMNIGAAHARGATCSFCTLIPRCHRMPLHVSRSRWRVVMPGGALMCASAASIRCCRWWPGQ